MPALPLRLLRTIDPERAHGVSLAAMAAWSRAGAPGRPTTPLLPIKVAGLHFTNPVGLAAGADKDARAVPAWFALGFGAVEVGTMTPLPQPGNPRPRLFRLTEDAAVINRFGFNNAGQAAGIARAAAATRAGVLGVNVGANKDAIAADRAIEDYARGVAAAEPVADYITINVSSPNTPGLRDLQTPEVLADLLAACRGVKNDTPLFLKVAPDLDATQADAITRAAIEGGAAALIVGNTTISRPPLAGAHAHQTGGLSGRPLAPLARQALALFRQASGGVLPLVAAGGIDSGAEAYARIRLGASLVQLYTALVYEGPALPARIVRDLAALLARDGFASVAEAVGVDA